MSTVFPRQDDGLGHAWGLQGDQPQTIWERFSDAYEAQAQTVWQCFTELGFIPALEWAGGQDGEAIIGRTTDGEIAVLFHLEDPEIALSIQKAIESDDLAGHIRQSIEAHKTAAQQFRK